MANDKCQMSDDKWIRKSKINPLTVFEMKLISISLGSWLLGLLTILLTFSVVEGESLSSADIKGVTFTSLIVAALVFPFVSAIVLNLPAFLIGILAVGRTLAPSEALAFIGAFILMGAAFGWGFVWNYQERAV
jgi:uncharacterized membrane protein